MTFLKTARVFLHKSKWLILGSVIFIFISNLYHTRIFSVRFVDEEDNFILGHFLLQGEKLYSDLFSHHQPLGYIFSAGLQLVTSPQNIYELIKGQREFMILWSLAWVLLLIWRFKEKIIIPLFIFELTKFYLLGNLFLSESLVVYPIIYLFLHLIDLRERSNLYEAVFIGFLISLSALLLAPVWPFLAAYIVILIWKRLSKKEILFLISGSLLPVLLVLPFIDVYYYFHNVFYINYKYYIPQSAEEKMPLSIIKALFSPVTALISNSDFNSSGFILKVIEIFFIVSIGLLIKKKNFKILIASLTLLTFSNLRYYQPGLQYSAGFHLLIWYGLFIVMAFYFYIDLIKSITLKSGKILLIGILLTGISLTIFSSKEIFKNSDPKKDYEANYLKQQFYGDAIKAMKNSGDTLFVIPDEWLLYFQGEVKNNNKMVNYYGWMSLVWELNDLVVDKFKTNPPAFFYCECEQSVVLSYSEDYRQMIKNGSLTPLWVLDSKYNSLNEQQRNNLRSLDFQLE